jgi:DNA-binding CsgD family transcriptional regulator
MTSLSPSPPVHGINREIAVEIERLVRELVQHCAERTNEPADASNVGDESRVEIVLELQVDGIPYRLTCAALCAASPSSTPRASLSPREREIVRLVARGLPNKSIAQALDISLWTVATHLRRIFAKLSVGTRAEMIARIHEDGLLRDSVAADAHSRSRTAAPALPPIYR